MHGLEWAENQNAKGEHDASEETKEGIEIMCISKKGSVNIISKIDEMLHTLLKIDVNFDKWAYISDLLPKGGEK